VYTLSVSTFAFLLMWGEWVDTYRVDEQHGSASWMQAGKFGYIIHSRVDDDPLDATINQPFDTEVAK
jgi:hypothetical protein